MSEKAVAFTITTDKAQPKLWKIKKCYLMTNPDVQEKLWNTKVYIRMTKNDCTMEDIIKMCEDNWHIPYIAGIMQGDVVSQKHISYIELWRFD